MSQLKTIEIRDFDPLHKGMKIIGIEKLASVIGYMYLALTHFDEYFASHFPNVDYEIPGNVIKRNEELEFKNSEAGLVILTQSFGRRRIEILYNDVLTTPICKLRSYKFIMLYVKILTFSPNEDDSPILLKKGFVFNTAMNPQLAIHLTDNKEVVGYSRQSQEMTIRKLDSGENRNYIQWLNQEDFSIFIER